MNRQFKTLIWVGVVLTFTVIPLAIFGLCIMIGLVFNMLKFAFY